MLATAGLVFAAAATVTLSVTPLARRLAVRTGMLDRPAARKPHPGATPYLGGLAVAAGVAAGALAAPEITRLAVVVAAGAAVLLLLGVVDDRRPVPARVRLLVQTLVAVATVQAGALAHVTGLPALDVALTLLWLVGIVNAVNLMDNTDGLAAGVVAIGAAGAAALAALGGQRLLVVLAAAVVGACAGFLAHNLRPATIFMGDAGSLLLGYLLAVITLEVTPAIAPPASFGVPLLLAALLVADTTTVTLARAWHGRPVMAAGTDHLSHRLLACGMPADGAVATLVGVQAALAAVAVALGRAWIGPVPAALVAAGLLGALLVFTLPAPVYGHTQRAARGPVLAGAGAGALALLAVSGWLLAGQPPTGEQLVISDSELVPSEQVRVTGRGFAPGSDVTLRLGALPLERLQAGSRGTVSATVTVPEAAPGATVLSARGRAPGGVPRVVAREVDVASAGPSRTAVPAAALAVAAAVTAAVACGMLVARRLHGAAPAGSRPRTADAG